MHEEVNQKVVSLCVRSAKMSATELEKVLKMFLDAQKQKKNQFAKGKGYTTCLNNYEIQIKKEIPFIISNS